MSTVDHERHSEDLGAYLLGALPELEAQMVERHIVGCAECKAELERLQPAADGSGTAAIPAGLHGVARVLVTRERAGGAPQPTEPPIISFRT